MIYGENMIVVVGIGYVGLVSAACFAEVGHKVVCLDIDSKKIQNLRQGIIPIYEPGLASIVRSNTAAGRLQFTTDYAEALQDADVAILAVDTPTSHDGTCDTTNLEAAARTLGQTITQDLFVIIKSTVPVGTSERIKAVIVAELEKRHLSPTLELISNPEFLREGCAVHDFCCPDRIVIGTSSDAATRRMKALYKPFNHPEGTFVFMDPTSSEMTKYAANTMLACRISFMNWLSPLCEKSGADIEMVRKAIGLDPRIGPHFLRAGIGFGGSCFPKDIRALRGMARASGVSEAFVAAIDMTNELQKMTLGEKIIAYFQERGGTEGKTIAVWGLSFKPDTDDMREAPSLILINQLLAVGIHPRLYDPAAMENAKKLLPHNDRITWCHDGWHAAQNADGIALVTEWKEFCAVDLGRLKQFMRGKAFFDGRNQYSPAQMAQCGFDYLSIGRAPVYGLAPVPQEQPALKS